MKAFTTNIILKDIISGRMIPYQVEWVDKNGIERVSNVYYPKNANPFYIMQGKKIELLSYGKWENGTEQWKPEMVSWDVI